MRTPRSLAFLCPLAVALALSGCSGLATTWLPKWGSRKAPSAREALGVQEGDERFREITDDTLDADLSRPRNGIRLSLRTDKQSYRINEPIMVDLRLENVGASQGRDKARDIPVYFEPVARTRDGAAVEWLFKFQIRSEPDQRLVYQSPDVKVADADRAEYYHYVTLPPQSFVGRRFIFWPARARGLLQPGRYSLVAAYTVDEDSAYVIINRHLTAQQVEALGTGLAYVRVWTGQVFSNRAIFQVQRKKWLGLF